ncbi:AAA family ATPase [Polyangium spumosum]|uniref:AAA family ATPase n=1 Tax=Polyangium spumosum TaxID=889282 RepID=A0A6N7PXP6_9BACT|nr:AAA family ATPase [Polyangium spumosum]MRG96763.1 AAA family ATPase [Polyangium spumosum]
MYIRKVAIANIRGFGLNAQDEDRAQVEIDLTRPDGSHAGWTVVAGRNGAGKSTFLKAIALAVAGPTAARSLEESFAGWIRKDASWGYMGVVIECDPFADGFTGRGMTPKDGAFWAEIGLERQESGPEPKVGPHNPDNRLKHAERGPWAENPRGWFIAGYGPFRRLSGHAADSIRLMAGPSRLARLVSLFREDSSLSECVVWLRDVAFRRAEGRPGAKELEDAVIKLLNDGLLPDGMRIHHIDSEGLWTERDGVILPLRDLSDGYRTVIALVLDIVKQLHGCYGKLDLGEHPDGHVEVFGAGAVLIDEIDIHLHVSWQQRIGFWLKTRFRGIQFIVTSHSPFICQAADPNGLIRLPAPGSREQAEHVSPELFKVIVNGGADEAAMSELFGLEKAHSDRSEELRTRVAELEAKLIRAQITPEEEAELGSLKQELPDTGSMAVEMALRAVRAAE